MLENPFVLRNKSVLLVGGSGSTESSIAKKLLSLKAQVLLLNNSDSQDGSNYVLRTEIAADFAECDFKNNSEFESVIKNISEKHGPLHGVVYCYGIGGVRPVQLTKQKFVEDMFIANVFAFIELLRIISKKNILMEGASIVALSSVSSIRGLKSKIAYSASKAALDAAVRSAAAEFGVRSIRVNSIQKGWVSTDMQQDFIQNNMALSGDSDFSKQILGVIEPEDIANAVAFLLSNGSRMITGTALVLDGGYTI
ncbi:MAG: SDR family oxidoreductase [Ignavibacteriales bacterium]|nr:MAG: SDR family oxidoreductase [Ignavibacteriales bacterium]